MLSTLCFAIPQVVSASWWNPFSWSVWNNIFHKTDTKTQVLENKVKELESKLSESDSINSTITETNEVVDTVVSQQSAQRSTQQKKSVVVSEKVANTEQQQTEQGNLVASQSQLSPLPPIEVSCSADINPNSSTFNTDFPNGPGRGYIKFKSDVSFQGKTGSEQIHYSWSGGCVAEDSSDCSTLFKAASNSSTTLTVSLQDGRKGTAICLPTAVSVSCPYSPNLITTKNQLVSFTATQDEDFNSYLYYWHYDCDSFPSANVCIMNKANGGGSFWNKVTLVSKDGSKIGQASCLAVICMPDNPTTGEWWMTRQTSDGKCEFVNCTKNSDCGINSENTTYKCDNGSGTCLKVIK